MGESRFGVSPPAASTTRAPARAALAVSSTAWSVCPTMRMSWSTSCPEKRSTWIRSDSEASIGGFQTELPTLVRCATTQARAR